MNGLTRMVIAGALVGLAVGWLRMEPVPSAEMAGYFIGSAVGGAFLFGLVWGARRLFTR